MKQRQFESLKKLISSWMDEMQDTEEIEILGNIDDQIARAAACVIDGALAATQATLKEIQSKR